VGERCVNRQHADQVIAMLRERGYLVEEVANRLAPGG
jgi:hypothetical protein